MRIDDLKSKVKKRETPFYDRIYRTAKYLNQMEIPYIPGLHDLLYHEKKIRTYIWRTFWRVVYYQPLFRSRCKKCGRNLYILNSGRGLPWIDGNIELYIGDGVIVYDRAAFIGLTVGEHPKIVIGDHTEISQPGYYLVGNEISIGSYCLLSSNLVTDNPGHNLHYKRRFDKLDKVLIGKIKIGNYVWAAHQSMILGNVDIGDGAIIGARAVVTKDIPPFCLVIGNPAKIVKKLPFPEELISEIGEVQYQRYLEAKVED